jgi:hypothetical protein
MSAVAFPALAQQSRDEERAAAQAARAADVHPYVPTPAEYWIERIQRTVYSPNPRAIVPFAGSAYPGGGPAFGPAFLARYADSGTLRAYGAWSFRNYLVADAALTSPKMADGRLTLGFGARWLRAPKVGFYGLGADTLQTDRTTFLFQTTTAGGSARLQPVRFVAVGGGVDYFDVTSGGTNSSGSIETRFTPETAPGVGADVTYIRRQAFAEIDWRESPGYSTSGGLYRLNWSRYGARDGAPFSFTRVDAELDQYIPILRASSVIALRAIGSFTDTEAGDVVPHFLLPELGGSRRLRGYPNWRFRDRHRLLFTGEYRWTAGRFVDMALFVDAGKVAARRSDLDLRNLNSSYGLGMRIHGPAATALRIELAKTRDDGLGFILTLSPPF